MSKGISFKLKKIQARSGVESGKISRKSRNIDQYIGTLEIRGKFPSSEMVHKLAAALGIDPTELFYKEINPETAIKNSQKVVIEDIGEAVNQLITGFFVEKVRKLDDEISELDT